MQNRWIGVVVVMMFTAMQVNAQRTQTYSESQDQIKAIKSLYEGERFVASKRQAERLISDVFPPSELKEEQEIYRTARYYRALSTAQLRQQDADHQLLAFIEDYPEALEANEAKFFLGQYYFISKKYKEVIPVLSSLDASLLKVDQSAKAHYYLGYSYFTRDAFKEARREFEQISSLKNEYHYPANYYLGLITYQDGDGEEALVYFNKLKESENYGRIIPYYIIKLQFELNKYDELLSYALPLSSNKEVKQLAGINYLIAQAYFKKNEFVKAIPYLKRYQEQGGQLVSEDYYQLGYAAYIGRDYKEAIKNLSKAASRTDSVGQSATFILGDSYLRLGQKEQALTSFYAASRLNADVDVQEIAAFNHAKLGYELNIHPQSLTWLKDFLGKYPRSKYADEAREHLGNLLLSTKNFKEAVEVIDGISARNLTINRSYQKVAYYRGVELFNQGVFHEAVKMFDKSLSQSIDKNLTAMAFFWKAEALYRLGDLKGSVPEYQRFLQAYPVTNGLDVENSLLAGHYGLGYAYFKQQEYLLAITQFESGLKELQSADKKVQSQQFVISMHGDLLLRLADAHFAINAYPQALGYYQQVVSRNLAGADYANYQEAILLGLTKQKDKKIQALQQMQRRFPGSLYLDNAMLELANTYFINDEYEAALKQIDTFNTRRPNSLLLKNALLIKGLILYNQEKYMPSLAVYKEVIARYPKTQESRDALVGVKNVYIQLNKVDDYLAYAATVPSATVTLSEQDSITFQAAELVYNQNNCEKATEELTRYLNRFPDGFFAVNARFLRADCFSRSGDTTLMLQDLVFIADQPRNLYSERVYARLARHFDQQKNAEQAVKYFLLLEQNSDSRWNVLDALQGLMRNYLSLANRAEARKYAERLKQFEHADEQMKLEADLVLAQILLAEENNSDAFIAFTRIYEQNKGEFGAAAKYYLAEIQFKRQEYVQSQNSIFELIDKIPYYDLWIGRSFLLLAETYVSLGEDFQAIATLQSIIDNRKADDITFKASERLKQLKARQVQGRATAPNAGSTGTNQGNQPGNEEPNQGGDQ